MRSNIRLPDAEQSYRQWVRPLALLFICGGLCTALVPLGHMGTPLPFVRSDFANRSAFAFVFGYCGVVGIGLLFRKKIAWYGLLAYLCFCVGFTIVYPTLISLDTLYAGPGIDIATVVLVVAFNAIFTVIVYLGTRPAFATVSPKAVIEADSSV